MNGIQNMSNDDLQRMMSMSGLQMNPDQLRASLNSMNDKDISNLKKQTENVDISQMMKAKLSPIEALTAKKN